MKKIRLLDIEFENEIQPWEVTAFRGAVIEFAGRKNIILHNGTKVYVEPTAEVKGDIDEGVYVIGARPNLYYKLKSYKG